MKNPDSIVATPPPQPEPPSALEQPTLATILSSDACVFVVQHCATLADLAALYHSILPRQPAVLMHAVDIRATVLIRSAPLCSAATNFSEEALWPVTIAAANWHPHPFFAALRAPACCRVAGSGTCSHGLCQKQETPMPGVFELLERAVACDERAGPQGDAEGPRTSVLAIECIARLNGALGRNEQALREWERAATAGSARAQLDVGIRRYSTGTASTVYEAPGAAPSRSSAAGTSGAASAVSLLRSAADSADLPALGLEGTVLRARALMLLGMMSLDGDGVAQDDGAAFEFFERVLRTVRAGKKLVAAAANEEQPPEEEHGADAASDQSLDESQRAAFWNRSRVPSLSQALLQAGADAQESMESMDRFMFFANGRP